MTQPLHAPANPVPTGRSFAKVGCRSRHKGRAVFKIEYLKGETVIRRRTSTAPRVDLALEAERPEALRRGAENLRLFDSEGNEIGVFPVNTGE